MKRYSIEFKVNIICCFFIFLALILLIIEIFFSKKIGGSAFNGFIDTVTNQYYVKDMEGNIREVSEVVWRKSYRLGVVFFISAILGTLSIFYLYARYSFWPTFIDNIMKTVNFFKNKR